MAETYEPIYQICFRRQYLVSKNQDEIDEQFVICTFRGAPLSLSLLLERA